MSTAVALIEQLGLKPHPEGGFYRETFRDPCCAQAGSTRGASTAIYFLLPAGVTSRWHRVDAVEVWHFYAGSPLELSSVGPDVNAKTTATRLGTDIIAGERPQAIVPAGHWQRARSLGAFTLVGCTVAPAFLFERFEIAAADLALQLDSRG